MQKTLIISGIFLLVVLAIGFAFFLIRCEKDRCLLFQWQKINATTNFEECAARGFPVLESYPRQCKAGTKTFTETVDAIAAKASLIRVTTPSPNSLIERPLVIEGEARG